MDFLDNLNALCEEWSAFILTSPVCPCCTQDVESYQRVAFVQMNPPVKVQDKDWSVVAALLCGGCKDQKLDEESLAFNIRLLLKELSWNID